jgi:FkbM family methyltransferase
MQQVAASLAPRDRVAIAERQWGAGRQPGLRLATLAPVADRRIDTMKLLPARLNDKPHYIFHPLRMVRRARYGGPSTAGRRDTAQLPWGLPLEVGADEQIGFTILTTGVFDPCVSETIHRLIDPGDLVVDVGANVGYMTSLAAVRAGTNGRVLAFEPHPVVFELLSANVARWNGAAIAKIEPQAVALSDRAGKAELNAGRAFHANMGLATLEGASEATAEDVLVPVELKRLDELIGEERIGLMKIDVEGHEPGVLRGSQRLLRSGLIRDVIFEDHNRYPSESTRLVEEAGYRLFSLSNDLFGVNLGAPAERGQVREWPGPSYLATREPERATERLRTRGWQIDGIGLSLRRRPRSA